MEKAKAMAMATATATATVENEHQPHECAAPGVCFHFQCNKMNESTLSMI